MTKEKKRHTHMTSSISTEEQLAATLAAAFTAAHAAAYAKGLEKAAVMATEWSSHFNDAVYAGSGKYADSLYSQSKVLHQLAIAIRAEKEQEA